MSMTENFDSALHKCFRLRTHISAELNTQLGMNAAIDEMSILFRDEGDMDKCVDHLLGKWAGHGVEVLPSVKCTRVTRRDQGAGQAFDVGYRFIKFLEFGWRLELMYLYPEFVQLEGQLRMDPPIAPLHDPLPQMAIVHASWKCRDWEDYEKVAENMKALGVPMKAEYSNDYGRFTYWGERVPYLKSRVNLRDV